MNLLFKRNVVLILPFISGIIIGRFLWDKIKLPYSNPLNVIGLMSHLNENPSNDILRFVIFIFMPSILLFLVYFFSTTKQKRLYIPDTLFPTSSVHLTFKKNKCIALFFIFFSVLTVIHFYNQSISICSFHDGETLGTAVSLESGKIAYKDVVFLHGIFRDPLHVTMAFKLFGRSISSMKIMTVLMVISAYISFALFFILFFQSNYWYYFSAFLIPISLLLTGLFRFNIPYAPARDVTVYLFLITVIYLNLFLNGQQVKKNYAKFAIVIFFFSFIPLASFTYSVDRGYYLCAAYILLFPIILMLLPKEKKYNIYFFLSAFVGISSSIIFIGILLKGNFSPFIEYLMLLPQYKGFLDGCKYPINRFFFIGVCSIIAFNFYWITTIFLVKIYHNKSHFFSGVFEFVKENLIEITVLILSVFTFNNALSRSDLGHIIYSTMLTYCFFSYILFTHVLPLTIFRWIQQKYIKQLTVLTIVVIISFFFYSIIFVNSIKTKFPFGVDDSKWIATSYARTADFLIKNLNKDEDFLTLTNEAIWYYLVNKPCPVRFPVIWFAAPEPYQKEVVEDLKTKNVKYIIFNNSHWANSIDGIPNKKKLPIIYEYVKKNYIFYKKIYDNELLIRKQM